MTIRDKPFLSKRPAIDFDAADFTNAVQALKTGQSTTHPIHTIYGWHVIKLLETRPAAAPAFEQVKAQLAVDIQQARYKAFLQSTLADASSHKST